MLFRDIRRGPRSAEIITAGAKLPIPSCNVKAIRLKSNGYVLLWAIVGNSK
jgi:hypothetical protein